MCTGTTRTCVFNMCAWCRHTRRRIEMTQRDCEWTHGREGKGGEGSSSASFCSSVKQVFLTFLSILTGCWVHLLSPIFCLPKFAHIWVITCFRGSPKKPLDLTFIENGASSIIERSALARCNVLIIRNRNSLQTICSATFAPLLSCSFFFPLFFYDDAMRMTTTQGQRPPRQRHVDNTPHPTTQPTTTRDTRHDTAPHNKKTKTHTYTHMYMYLYVYMHMSVFMYMSVSYFCSFLSKKKTQSGTRTFHDVYCSKPLTFHNG